MELWRVVLEADRKDDLTRPGASLAWLSTVPELGVLVPGPEWEKPDDCPPPAEFWTREHDAAFVRTVETLRSLARRLKNFRGRKSSLGDHAADAALNTVFAEDVCGRLIHRARGRDPLRRRTFIGVRFAAKRRYLDPDEEDRISAGVAAGRLRGLACGCYENLVNFHNQALVSLVVDDHRAVCGRCGRDLDDTPTGRPSRAKFCGKCVYDRWWAKQSDADRKAKWRRDKQRQRADAAGAAGAGDQKRRT
jgi:hypothetical protein